MQLCERRGRESVSPHHTCRGDCGGGGGDSLHYRASRSAVLGSPRPRGRIHRTARRRRSGRAAPALPALPLTRRTSSRLKMLSLRVRGACASLLPPARPCKRVTWNFRRARLECRIAARDRVILARPTSYRELASPRQRYPALCSITRSKLSWRSELRRQPISNDKETRRYRC